MLESGKKFRHLVQFTSGQPTSPFVYTLYNQNGGVVLTNSVTIPNGQLSVLIEIPAANNVLTKPLFEKMRLEWSYTTAIAAVDESISYVIHLPVAFPVSEAGVRSMLGMSEEELPDEDIKLFEGYLAVQELLGPDVILGSYADDGTMLSYHLSRAMEAATALRLLPTLQIRLPRKYDSGTSSYERWNNIDWAALATSLTGILGAGLEAIIPEFEYYNTSAIFVLSDRGADPITGE